VRKYPAFEPLESRQTVGVQEWVELLVGHLIEPPSGINQGEVLTVGIRPEPLMNTARQRILTLDALAVGVPPLALGASTALDCALNPEFESLAPGVGVAFRWLAASSHLGCAEDA
jgi:hypothetical protein